MSEDSYVVGEICASPSHSGKALLLSTDLISSFSSSGGQEKSPRRYGQRPSLRQRKSRTSSVGLTVSVYHEEDSHW
jgi:hypothetical protein